MVASLPRTTARRQAGFDKRRQTIMKKAYELSTLCGTDVCVICYSPDGMVQTWPENTAKVKDMAEKYKRLSETEKSKRRLDLSGFLEKMKLDDEKKSGGDLESKFPSWDKRLDVYSAQKLSELEGFLGRKLQCLKERVKFLEQKKPKEEKEDTDQSRNSWRTLGIYPPVLSNFETGIASFPGDQQQLVSANLSGEAQFLAENTMLNNCYHNQSFFMGNNNVGTASYCDSDCSSSNSVLNFNESSIPQTRYQNLLANGVAAFLGTAMSRDINFRNYSGVMMPQGYYENVMIVNNFNDNPQLQFQQLSASTPHQDLGLFLPWDLQQQPFQG